MIDRKLDSSHDGLRSDRKIAFEFSLSELNLLDGETDQEFDNLVQLAAEMLGTSVSLVSIVDQKDGQLRFKSQTGLPDPWKSAGQIPLGHSFCQHVVSQNAPLAVNDARQHTLVQDPRAIELLSVIAYLGVPVHTPDGAAFGALCVICTSPRAWSNIDQKMLTRVAACVDDLIKLRVAHRTSENLQQELQEFSEALSHDIKSPTRSLVLIHREIAESLGEAMTSDVKLLLDLCHVATDRTTQMVDNIQKYARLFDNVPAFEALNLTQIVKEVLNNFDSQIEGSEAQITLENLPTIDGNKALLHGLLTQLISNALIYTLPEKAPKIEISSQLSRDGKTATVYIRDSGIGIPLQYRERVFRLFERLHPRSEYPGHGIGLALCQRIVDIHSGAIEIQSTNSCGTVFIVDLPVNNHD